MKTAKRTNRSESGSAPRFATPAALRAELARVGSILERRIGRPRRYRPDPPLDELIWTMLSQSTTDRQCDEAFRSLRRRFPTWEDALRARPAEIADTIRAAGLARQRSRRILDLLRWVKARFGALDLGCLRRMEPEEAARLLMSRPGIGRKTTYVVLLFACGMDVFPVDTHILRVARRRGWIPARAGADAAHRILGEAIPRGMAQSLHLNVIAFGRRICRAQRPLCGECFLARSCPSYGSFSQPVY